MHSPGASPLRRGYLASNPGLIALLAGADAALQLIRRKRFVPLPASPRRVLLALGGHLGDAVIATAAIEHLYRSLPGAELGIVMPSWSRVVLEGDPRLRWIHLVDHWKSNRSDARHVARWRRYNATRRSALREIRAVGYDVAVDLYGYFPNMALTLTKSKIPIRLGFTSGGLGPLYTHALPWSNDLRQVAERQVELASTLTSTKKVVDAVRYSLPETTRDAPAAARVAAILLAQRMESGNYIVIHPGTGAAHREWPAVEWRNLARQLRAEGHRLVFTGRGAREAAVLSEISAGVDGATNLCDALDWHELVEVVRRARLVITVETAAAHVAAAVGTPCVALWSGTANARYWQPLGSHVAVVTATRSGHMGSHAEKQAPVSNVRAILQRDVQSAVHDLLAATVRGSSSVSVACAAKGVR